MIFGYIFLIGVIITMFATMLADIRAQDKAIKELEAYHDELIEKLVEARKVITKNTELLDKAEKMLKGTEVLAEANRLLDEQEKV